jgi:hypothetical protein
MSKRDQQGKNGLQETKENFSFTGLAIGNNAGIIHN